MKEEQAVSVFSHLGTNEGQAIQLVRWFEIEVPVLASDDEAQRFRIDIEVGEPEQPNEHATFRFQSRDFEDAVLEAMKREVDELRKALNEYTIIYGAV